MLDFKTNVSCVLESVFAGFKDENIEIATDNITKLYINDLIKLKAEMLENIVITLKDETDEAVLEHNKTIYSNIAIIDNHIYKLKGGAEGMSNLFYEQLEKQSNGTDLKEFAIAELEKIICELRNCYPSMPIFNKRKWREENKAYLDCESIIFKHISELKGEINAN